MQGLSNRPAGLLGSWLWREQGRPQFPWRAGLLARGRLYVPSKCSP
ncbi:MAG: hypothetical protein H5U05_10405 [Candidatus Aminicenantes bacterium]|nr:hypothetical protein [Candidatus Aminicenantes bacterium]